MPFSFLTARCESHDVMLCRRDLTRDPPDPIATRPNVRLSEDRCSHLSGIDHDGLLEKVDITAIGSTIATVGRHVRRTLNRRAVARDVSSADRDVSDKRSLLRYCGTTFDPIQACIDSIG